ncbi:MAG: BON domain-containing protein, partial [Planctomycetaceae bacterium]
MSRDPRDPGQSPEHPASAPDTGEFASLFAQLEPSQPARPTDAAEQPLGSWLTHALGAVPEPQTRARDLEFEQHQAELLARSNARRQVRPTAASAGAEQSPATVAKQKSADQKSAGRVAASSARPADQASSRPTSPRRETPPAVAPPDAPLPASPPTAAQATPEPNEATDTSVEEFELLHGVNLELARYPALAGLALQFSATRGHVTVVGDLRSEYERQLVRHFVKSVRGVTELTDLTRVPAAVGPSIQAVASTSAPVRRRSSSRGVGTGWALPPQAKSMAALALITLLAWTGFSFAKRGDGLPKVHPARGQVLLPGYPLEGALLVLHPTQAGAIARPRATMRDDGHFELTTHSAG